VTLENNQKHNWCWWNSIRLTSSITKHCTIRRTKINEVQTKS